LTVFDGTSKLSLDGEPLGAGDAPEDVDALLEELNDLDENLDEEVEAAQAFLGTRERLPEALLALEAELIDDLHSVGNQLAATQDDEIVPTTEEEAVLPVDLVSEAPAPAEVEPTLAVNLAPDITFADLDADADEFEDPPAPRSRATLALILLALVALPAQVLWFQYETWIMDPAYRPIYSSICSLAGCDLPHLRDVSKIASKKSIIRAHPDRDDARVVDVLMVNNAEFAQPFPLIELMATTLRGQLVAGRRFRPAEYLQGEIAQIELLPPNTPVHVSLEIQDPGDQALNFEVRFR